MELTDDRIQQIIIPLVAASRVAAAALLGTAMAVYIGREASPFAVSLAVTTFHFGMLVFAPIWGAVADITGRRRGVLIATTVLAALSILPLLLYHSVWIQIGIRGLYAVFVSGIGSVLLTIVSERGGANRRGQSVGLYNSTVAVGGIGGRLLVGVLLGVLVPSGMYLLIAGITTVSAVATVFVADPTSTPDRRISLSKLVGEVRRRLFPAVAERDHLKTNGLS